jgi:hypothetical protein
VWGGPSQLPACRCMAVSRPLAVLNEQHDETHACMVHTGLREGSRLRLLGVLHEQHEEHDDTPACMVHVHSWREVSRLRTLGGCTPRTARATRVAETPACMVHTEDEPVAYDRCTSYISSSDTCLDGAHWQSTATTGCAARAT